MYFTIFPAPCHLGPKGPCYKVVLVHLVHVHKKYKTGVGNRRCVNRVFLVYYLWNMSLSLIPIAHAIKLAVRAINLTCTQPPLVSLVADLVHSIFFVLDEC